jgi:uncharacterized protein (UPF0332 family)
MIPADFISFAANVVTLGPVGARSATSRSYYGVFHVAQQILAELGVHTPRSGPGHAILANYLISVTHDPCREAGRLLSQLHHLRNKADYDVLDLRQENLLDAQKNIAVAQYVVDLLQTFQRACLANDALLQDLLQAVAKVDAVRQVRK